MQQTATRNIVGVFEEYSIAERVARDLANVGISRDAIEVKSNFRTGAAGGGAPAGEHEGGISGFFHRLFGGNDSEADEGHYAEAVRRGNAVVSVTAPESQIDEVVEIMNAAGAVDIDHHVANYREGGDYKLYDPNAPAYSYDEAVQERERFRASDQANSIPVIEEELQVGKRVVRRGGVRIYTRVVDQPVEENIQLREEHVRVERRPVNRPVTAEDTGRLRDQSIEIAEMAEEPVVQKRARVREEVVIGKESTQRTQKIRETVRHTEVDVQPVDQETYDADFRQDWKERYANDGDAYEMYQPAYDYGYRSAGDARYKDRDWSDVEDDLRTDYMRANPNSNWDRMKGAVRYGWEKMTGKR